MTLVIGANADRVEVQLLQQVVVVEKNPVRRNAVLHGSGGGLSGYDIGPANNIHPGKSTIGLRRGVAGPTGANDSYLNSFLHPTRSSQRVVSVAHGGHSTRRLGQHSE